MKRITYIRPPKKMNFIVGLDNFYDKASEPGRQTVKIAYEGMFEAIKTALFICGELFALCEFDTKYAMEKTEEVCSQVLQSDHIDGDCDALLLAAMECLVKDVYAASLEYARHLTQKEWTRREVIEEMIYPEWEVYRTHDLDNTREIHLIIDPPGD